MPYETVDVAVDAVGDACDALRPVVATELALDPLVSPAPPFRPEADTVLAQVTFVEPDATVLAYPDVVVPVVAEATIDPLADFVPSDETLEMAALAAED